MFGQSLLSAFGIACTTDTDQLFDPAVTTHGTTATYQLDSNVNSLPIAGKFDGCALYSGTGSNIVIGGLSSMFSTKATFSVSLWFKTTEVGNKALFDDYTAQNYNIQLYLYDGVLNVSTRFSNGDSNMPTTATTYNDGQWHNVVVTSDQTTYNTYIDGGSPTTWTPSTNSYSGGTASVTIGSAQGGASNSWAGEIDQVRIFSSALTASQAADLASETRSTASTLNYPTTATALYELNANAADTGGNYNGSSSSITWEYNASDRGVTYTAGKFGNAATYSGTQADTGTRIYVGNQIYNGNTSVFSVSLWVKCTNTSGEIPLSGNGGTIGGTQGYALYLENGKLSLTFRSSNGSQDFYGNTTYINDDAWHHLVLTFNNGPYAVYLDGSVSFSGTTSNFLNNTTPSFDTYFGNRWNRSENGVLAGQMDQIRVFGSTAIDQATVTALYNETTTTATYNYVDVDVYNSVAYYKMSNATDQLGNYNGTAVNMNWGEGKFGFAGLFNGSSSAIVIPNNILSSDFSISAWFYLNNTSGNQYLFEFDYECRVIFRVASTDSNWAYIGNSGYFNPGITYNAGQWYHLVITFSNGNPFKIYVDNTLSYTGGNTSTNTTSNDNILGAASNSGSGAVNGKIDQVRVYNTALTATQVDTLYKEVYCQPTAIVGTNFFNTVLYTGNGGTQSVTGVGFKPDFSWVKNRNTGGNSHELADAIRGVNNTLNSNTASGEYNNATYQFNSFDTDGITVTDDAAGNYAVNGNNETYVAWNWKGGSETYGGDFNGSTSVITTGLNTGNNNMTFSAWVNLSGASSGIYGMVCSGITNYYTYLSVGQNGKVWISNDQQIAGDADNGYATEGTTVLQEGQWYHIAGSLSSTDGAKIYVNGVLEKTQSARTSNAPAISPPAYSAIGAWKSSNGNLSGQFNGKIDQIRMFNTVLNATQISDLYNEAASDNNTLNFPAGAGCIAAYTLNETANDLSGNYNGTASNVNYTKPGYLGGNVNGSIPSQVVANPNGGFSIVKYIGNGSTSASVGHGLSSPPELVFVKRTDSTTDWYVWATPVMSITGSSSDYMVLNSTAAKVTAGSVTNLWGGNVPSSTTIGVGDSSGSNASGGKYISYCFTSIPGYSRISSYVGTGGALDVYCGFQPSYVMIKRTDNTGYWVIVDSKRASGDNRLYANVNNAEDAGQGESFYSNGFRPRNSNTNDTNTSGATYIFIAIA